MRNTWRVLMPGETREVSITIRNTGTTTCRTSRILLEPDERIMPGRSKAFKFRIEAPGSRSKAGHCNAAPSV